MGGIKFTADCLSAFELNGINDPTSIEGITFGISELYEEALNAKTLGEDEILRMIEKFRGVLSANGVSEKVKQSRFLATLASIAERNQDFISDNIEHTRGMLRGAESLSVADRSKLSHLLFAAAVLGVGGAIVVTVVVVGLYIIAN